ncbi:hypothetical protein B0J14DRAFT_704709 [Halenospora varia]|nr:hypothetical protein B0J14DRAFT_704709 [Halenospora varia]
MAHDMLIDKKEPEGSDDSMNSPEAEALEPLQDTAVAQKKRRGGRKPIYATSEERKQRNRQAQAAFRERRTEYIKQLEETIRVHEANLHSLQTTHRITGDECLMLRYKNSLLERILLEKGIDVQAELGTKNSIPKLVPTDDNNASYFRFSNSGTEHCRSNKKELGCKGTNGTPVATIEHPSPSQGHMEEEEYEKQTDIFDEDLPQSGPGPYPESLPPMPALPQILISQDQSIDQHRQVHQLNDSSTGHTFMNQLLEHDMNPFGLSAGMNFQTSTVTKIMTRANHVQSLEAYPTKGRPLSLSEIKSPIPKQIGSRILESEARTIESRINAPYLPKSTKPTAFTSPVKDHTQCSPDSLVSTLERLGLDNAIPSSGFPTDSRCICGIYGNTRGGDRIKLDCGGTRCGGYWSCSDSEEEDTGT